MTYYFQIEAFSKLISKQSIYKDIISNSKLLDQEYYTKIQNSIDQSWSRSLDYYINQIANLSGITKKEELINVIEKRKEEAKRMNEKLNVNPSPAIDEYLFDYDEQLNKNMALLSEQEIQIKSIQNDHDGMNESLKINRLFNSNSSKEWDDLPF
jgi:predicted Zn-ribbon and HTH transcriptional regulator